MKPRTIILWDIDHTLLSAAGAGSIAMARAFHEIYGVLDAYSRIEFSGRSDTAIFREVAKAHGVAHDDAALQRFIAAYAPALQVSLTECEGSVMPGVIAVLKALEARGDAVSGLGTGNFRRTGEAKLLHYGIAQFFPGCVGGFGDDHEEREELIRVGIERLRNRGSASRVVVVGDTPHDVAAAKGNNAFAFAVATGRDSVADLLACGADVAIPDLSDTGAVLELLLG